MEEEVLTTLLTKTGTRRTTVATFRTITSMNKILYSHIIEVLIIFLIYRFFELVNEDVDGGGAAVETGGAHSRYDDHRVTI